MQNYQSIQEGFVKTNDAEIYYKTINQKPGGMPSRSVGMCDNDKESIFVIHGGPGFRTYPNAAGGGTGRT
jgi:hypothetical protein